MVVEGRSQPVSWREERLREDASRSESSASSLTRLPLLERAGRLEVVERRAESAKCVLRALRSGFLGFIIYYELKQFKPCLRRRGARPHAAGRDVPRRAVLSARHPYQPATSHISHEDSVADLES